MASVPASASSGKRSLKGVDAGMISSAKKQKISTVGGRSEDIGTIKSIIGEINDPAIKAALETIIGSPSAKAASAIAVTPRKDEAALQTMTKATARTIQQLINDKLKWKGSFKQLRGGGLDNLRGARVEVACSEPEVFERIFEGAAIKRGKDGRLSCAMKTEDEARKWGLPFKGRSYRYNKSYLSEPYTATLKDSKLTFGFKFGIW